MLRYVITFFVLSVAMGALGFGAFAGTPATVARVLCVASTALLVVAVYRGTVPITAAQPDSSPVPPPPHP